MYMHIVQDIKLSDETNKASSIFFYFKKTHYKYSNIDDILLCLELIERKKPKKKKKILYRKKLDHENGLPIVVITVMEYRRELGNDH